MYGAGLYIHLKALVTLEDTVVSGNVATRSGGGIYIRAEDGAVLTLDQGSAVMSNSAPNAAYGNGGGIYCSTLVPSSVIGLLDGFIYDNEAANDGGGLYLWGCGLTSYSGGALRGIVGNRAGRGGGVFANSGALLRFYGGSQHPATLDSNSSTAAYPDPGWPYGSGARIEGAGTRLELHDSWVPATRAATRHRGHRRRQRADRPHVRRRLSRSGALLAHRRQLCGLQIFNTSLTLRETFSRRTAPWPGGLLERREPAGRDRGRRLRPEHPHGTRAPAGHHRRSGPTRIAYSTFVDNLTDATGWTQYVLGLEPAGGSRDLTFVGNLVAETAGVLVDTYDDSGDVGQLQRALRLPDRARGGVVASRLHRHPGPARVRVPTSSTAPGHDYHLSAGSAPIDICDTLHFAPGLDIDHQTRGYEDATLPNWYGPYDLGADERVPASLLFADGFETGNTSRWSATTP